MTARLGESPGAGGMAKASDVPAEAPTDVDGNRPGPFFIVGASRSGTTLLRVTLDRHPLIAIPPESHFIPTLWRRRRRYGAGGRVQRPEALLEDLARDRRFRDWGIPIERVRDRLTAAGPPTLEAAIELLYREYAQAKGKPVWADKTPEYVWHMELLGRLFSKASFVHLVRDGRDVALSMLDLNPYMRHAAATAPLWKRSVRSAREAGRAMVPGRYVELRYEDLILDPETTLRRLLESLSVPFDSSVLGHDARAIEAVPEARRSRHQRLALPPTRGLRNWRQDMRPAEAAEFEAIAGRELVAFGYEVTAKPTMRRRAGAWKRVGGYGLRTLGPSLRSRVRWLRRSRHRRRVGRRLVVAGRQETGGSR
ncbi:MAG TPA: sulfotransferase [Actinomycetota bacterium]|nr:sulfotransferase [Actinomycetota bacterium]